MVSSVDAAAVTLQVFISSAAVTVIVAVPFLSHVTLHVDVPFPVFVTSIFAIPAGEMLQLI
jgi:hypothetical protein